MLKNDICKLFGIKYPIVQGGMAHLATAELASAVSNAGGLGVIAAANYESEWLEDQIQTVHKRTDKPIGVNLFLPSQYLQNQIRVVIKEKVPVVFTGAGNPVEYISSLKKAGIIVVPVLSKEDLALKVQSKGADAVVAEGTEAGGHIGNTSIFTLIPLISNCINLPVIAAGGIVDGKGLSAIIALGAQGIQMGTRFILSTECNAHPKFKNLIISSTGDNTVVIGKSIGRPIRCFKNQFASNYLELEKANASKKELDAFIQGRIHLGIIDGDIDEGLLMIGQSSCLVKEIKPVKDIFLDMINQAKYILTELSSISLMEELN